MKTPKLHTLLIQRTNAAGIDFEKTETKTLEEWNNYYGKEAKTIRGLVSIVNREHAERYASCYRLSYFIKIIS